MQDDRVWNAQISKEGRGESLQHCSHDDIWHHIILCLESGHSQRVNDAIWHHLFGDHLTWNVGGGMLTGRKVRDQQWISDVISHHSLMNLTSPVYYQKALNGYINQSKASWDHDWWLVSQECAQSAGSFVIIFSQWLRMKRFHNVATCI